MQGPDDEWFERLERLGALGERERRQHRAQRMGFGFVDLDRVRPDPRADGAISNDLARELRALPLVRDGRNLWIAFAERDSLAEARIAQETGLRVIPVLCVPSALDAALESLDPLKP